MATGGDESESRDTSCGGEDESKSRDTNCGGEDESESRDTNCGEEGERESRDTHCGEKNDIAEDDVNNQDEGGVTSHLVDLEEGSMEIQESGVDDNLTDVVTPALKLVFNILMPCVDIYTDASLIVRLHPQFWGCILVILSGLLLHFFFTCFAWWRLEPRAQKRWSWIFLLLQIWPQLKAIQVSKFYG